MCDYTPTYTLYYDLCIIHRSVLVLYGTVLSGCSSMYVIQLLFYKYAVSQSKFSDIAKCISVGICNNRCSGA